MFGANRQIAVQVIDLLRHFRVNANYIGAFWETTPNRVAGELENVAVVPRNDSLKRLKQRVQQVSEMLKSDAAFERQVPGQSREAARIREQQHLSMARLRVFAAGIFCEPVTKQFG